MRRYLRAPTASEARLSCSHGLFTSNTPCPNRADTLAVTVVRHEHASRREVFHRVPMCRDHALAWNRACERTT